jgi:hypothetical protein
VSLDRHDAEPECFARVSTLSQQPVVHSGPGRVPWSRIRLWGLIGSQVIAVGLVIWGLVLVSDDDNPLRAIAILSGAMITAGGVLQMVLGAGSKILEPGTFPSPGTRGALSPAEIDFVRELIAKAQDNRRDLFLLVSWEYIVFGSGLAVIGAIASLPA